ncbi:MAG: HAD hydrolase-like protein [Dehalococcoidia bacterium]|nr:HAD hydrolase-like protein [Dehalococcoidia bacterium]
MSLRAVIFDFDGLILDTEMADFVYWCEIYEARGHALDSETWARGIGTRGGFDPYVHLETLTGAVIDRDVIRAEGRPRLEALLADLILLEGVEARLDEARELGLKIGLASSSDRYWIEPHLERFGLASRFDVIRCGGEGGGLDVHCSAELDHFGPRPVSGRHNRDQPGGRLVVAPERSMGKRATSALSHPMTVGQSGSRAGRRQLLAGMLGLGLLMTLVMGCSGDDEPSRFAKPGAHVLGEWLGVPEDSLRFEQAEEATWPNGCMGAEWPGRVCSQALVSGHKLTFRSANDQPHFVHVSDAGDYVWAPIWETETEIVSISGQSIRFTPTRGGFSSQGRIVPGTTIEGTPRAGARVFAAESSGVTDADEAPLVLLIVLE